MQSNESQQDFSQNVFGLCLLESTSLQVSVEVAPLHELHHHKYMCWILYDAIHLHQKWTFLFHFL